MPMYDAFGERKKHNVMEDTWGHLYPEPKRKYPGEMVVAAGEYGDAIIVSSDFPYLNPSPMRYELEHSIFGMYEFEPGVYRITCSLHFFKTCRDMYLGKPIGRIIKIKIKQEVKK